MSARLGWAVAGSIFAVASLLVTPFLGLEISSDLLNDDGLVTWLNLFGGVFVAASLMWRVLMPPGKPASLVRGGVAGSLIALLAYPVVLALAALLQHGWQVAPSLAERVDRVLLVSGLALMTTGFVSTLIGAVVGIVTAWLLARVYPPRPEPSGWQRRYFALAGTLAAVIVASLIGAYAWTSQAPLDTAALQAQGVPTAADTSYAAAIAAFDAIAAREATLGLHQACHSTLLTHGAKTARAVIYFHGFSSCPAQGDALAARLFAMGYNVYLPRMNGHGEAIPSSASMAELDSAHLVELANQSVDIAHGLGDEVVVTGLSAGGTLAAWTAQYRADVDQVIAISPFFGPFVVPPWATQAATNLALTLPDVEFAFNPLQNVEAGPDIIPAAMPTTRALAEVMLVGQSVIAAAKETPPAAGRVGFLLNEADIAVNNHLTGQLIAQWRSHGAEVNVVMLPFSSHLPHDIINPRERGAQVDLVNAALIEMMRGGGARP